MHKEETSDSDFSADESDEYQPDDTAKSQTETEEDSSSDDDVPLKIIPPKPVPLKLITAGRSTRSNARKQHDFVPESDGYFAHHTKKKVSCQCDVFTSF